MREVAILDAWISRTTSEQRLREKTTNRILGIVILQVVATVGLVIAAGVGLLQLPPDFYRFGLPSMAAVQALALVIMKYLFDRSSRQSLDTMMQALRGSASATRRRS
jgi:hypothetical protein